MENPAVGVFDSGLGGLTAVKPLIGLAPKENIVYFGDTARVPYGGRSAETITRYAKQAISFLLSQNVKLLLNACGTMSSTLNRDFTDSLPVPYIGVIEAAARAAVLASKNGRIGIMATAATIKSNSFSDAVSRLNADAQTFSAACPLLVPLVEDGYISRDNAVTRMVVRDYLSPIMDSGVDTLILGCTHYPIIKDLIADAAGRGVTLIDSGLEAAKSATERLDGSLGGKSGSLRIFTSDRPHRFMQTAEMFLGKTPESVSHINIETIEKGIL